MMPRKSNSCFCKMFGLTTPSTLFLAAVASTLCSSPVFATWSILIADTQTGEIVIGSATCVESIDLRRETPVLISGVGAVTAQSAVDISGNNRMLIRDRLLQQVSLEDILQELSETDSGHLNRQYGFINTLGEQLTYSGVQNAAWAGGTTGRIERGRPGPADDIVYSVQGNILSGANVVDEAVQAIVNSDTDLPGMLMNGMMAAREAGGDGRCSCSNGNPTGCGSPPPAPFKSSHVAYMLGARADDIDSSRAFYPITNQAGGITVLDINHDGMNDVVIGDAINNDLNVFLNGAQAGDPLSHVIPSQTVQLNASGVVALRAGDMNADGFEDVIIAQASPSMISVLLGNESGSLALESLIDYALPAAPTGLTVGEWDTDVAGDEIIVTTGSTDQVHILAFDDQSSIEHKEALNIDGQPGIVYLSQLFGDDRNDLVVALDETDSVRIYRGQGGGDLAFSQELPIASDAAQISSGDFNDDGSIELVVLSDTGRRVEIFEYSETQWNQTQSITVNRDGQGLAIGDFNGDSSPDIITTSSSPQRNLQVFVNDGAGEFTFDQVVKVGRDARFVTLEDMNASGDLDLVIANAGEEGLILLDNPRGSDLPQPGRFADGDYFLEMNIANQRDDDPDPVDVLAAEFAAWRQTLDGRVDAIRSRVIARERFSTNMNSSMTIELRDWEGEFVKITDPDRLSVSAMDPDLMQIGAVELVEPGVFRVAVIAGNTTGTSPVIVRILNDPGNERLPVRLMPDYAPTVVENLSDFYSDGRFNFFDVSFFMQSFTQQDPDADINGDLVIDFLDIQEFLKLFP